MHTMTKALLQDSGCVQWDRVADRGHRRGRWSSAEARVPCPSDAGARILGRVIAGLLAVVLTLSVVVNFRYGWVARQYESATASNSANAAPLALRAIDLESGV
ncbi:MAG: hypothetical protein U1E63_10030 [Burkholderiales bacterium]